MTTTGREFFKDKCLQKIWSSNSDGIVQAVEEVLREAGVVANLQYSLEDRLFRVKIQGCIHLAVEQKMMGKGIVPFTCLPANLIVLAIGEKLNRPVELAQIKVENGACQLLLVLFEKGRSKFKVTRSEP